MTEATVRTIRDDELATWLNVVRTAFLEPAASDEMVAFRRTFTDLSRSHASVDADGRLAGVAYAFPTPLTVPGGGEVPTGAVSAVGVLPTHRRRGHLTGLMRAQLADIAERGEPVAALIAAEYPIYGRFGYGPAAEAVALRIDAHVARWLDEPTGAVELVDNETFAKEVDAVYDRVRRATPGHIGWDTERWRIHAGVDPYPDGDEETRRKAMKALWRDDSGEVQAATTYSVEEKWVHNRPGGQLTARPLVAATPRGSLELMRYLTEVDWVTDVTVHLRPVDEPAPLALVDGRTAYLSDRSDHLWVRILDVPTALAARRYAAPGALVLEVVDPLGFAAGRFRLEGGPEGAECAPTDEEPDLAFPVRALGAAYLGGQGWGRLAAAGWVDELRPGGLARAEALFATLRAPFCALTF
jgi:predicted acetyltransferase